MYFFEQKHKFKRIKTKSNWKCKIVHIVSERWTLCFSTYKNRKLKVKLWWFGARKRKKGHILYYLLCPKEFFRHFLFYLNVCCIEYTFRIYILLHIKKRYLKHIFLVLKIVKSPQCILKVKIDILVVNVNVVQLYANCID